VLLLLLLLLPLLLPLSEKVEKVLSFLVSFAAARGPLDNLWKGRSGDASTLGDDSLNLDGPLHKRRAENGATLTIRQDFVRLRELLELGGRFLLVVGVFVRVPFQGQTAVTKEEQRKRSERKKRAESRTGFILYCLGRRGKRQAARGVPITWQEGRSSVASGADTQRGVQKVAAPPPAPSHINWIGVRDPFCARSLFLSRLRLLYLRRRGRPFHLEHDVVVHRGGGRGGRGRRLGRGHNRRTQS
jgi:hypothetical protein